MNEGCQADTGAFDRICYNNKMTTDSNDAFYKYQLPDRKHRTQSFWQIWVPLFVILLLVVGFFVAALIITESGTQDLGQIQNAAIILMVLPMALIGLLTFIALGLAIAGTSRAMRFIPRLRLLSMQLDSITATITTWSNRIMLPFVVARRVREKLSIKKNRALKQQSLD
jgi:hypothetical protein